MSSNILDSIICFFRPDKRVGLALSGGVAKGIAHIGVLKALKRHKVPIHYISGTSSGSIIAAFYAAGMDPDIIEVTARKLDWFRFLRIFPSRQGPLNSEDIQKFVLETIGNKKFSDLNLPLFIATCDIRTGTEVMLDNGRVATAVAASCSFPGIFSPLKIGGELLVDGGLVNNLPSSAFKPTAANFVIASDCIGKKPIKQEPQNGFQIFGRALDLILEQNSQEGRKLANVLIEPRIPEDIWHLDIDEAPRLVEAGEAAAEKKILEIRAKLAIS